MSPDDDTTLDGADIAASEGWGEGADQRRVQQREGAATANRWGCCRITVGDWASG